MGPSDPEVAWSIITTQLHLLAFLAGRLVERRGLYQPIGKPLFAGENDGLKSTHCSNLPVVPSPFSPESDQQFARCSRRVGTRGFPCGLRISTAKRRSSNANRHLELRSLAATEVGWDPLNATKMNGDPMPESPSSSLRFMKLGVPPLRDGVLVYGLGDFAHSLSYPFSPWAPSRKHGLRGNIFGTIELWCFLGDGRWWE